MEVMGLDLSLTGTGIATADKLLVIKTKADQDMTDRLVVITEGIIDQYHITAVDHTTKDFLIVIEDLPIHAHGAGKTAMVHGAVRLALSGLGGNIRLLMVPPASLKVYATGKGNATKGDMRMAYFKETGLDQRDDNKVDAIYLYWLGNHVLGEPKISVPKNNLRSMSKLNLPDGIEEWIS